MAERAKKTQPWAAAPLLEGCATVKSTKEHFPGPQDETELAGHLSKTNSLIV